MCYTPTHSCFYKFYRIFKTTRKKKGYLPYHYQQAGYRKSLLVGTKLTSQQSSELLVSSSADQGKKKKKGAGGKAMFSYTSNFIFYRKYITGEIVILKSAVSFSLAEGLKPSSYSPALILTTAYHIYPHYSRHKNEIIKGNHSSQSLNSGEYRVRNCTKLRLSEKKIQGKYTCNVNYLCGSHNGIVICFALYSALQAIVFLHIV